VVMMVMAILTFQTGGSREAPLLTGGRAIERSTLSSEGFLQNSRFVVTKASTSYDVNTSPKCWIRHCDKPNNWRAFESCDATNGVATEWNSLGVHTMARYVGSSAEKLEGLKQQMLTDALDQFSNATKLANNKCFTPLFNLALVYTKLGRLDTAAELYEKALALAESNEVKAIVHLHWGLSEEVRLNGRNTHISHYDKVRQLDQAVERDYWGVATTSGGRKELSGYGPQQTPPALVDFLLYKHFASVSIPRYSLIKPGSQDAFIEFRFSVLRHVLPPYVLSTAQKCFRDMIDSGQLKFGDGQADRYVTYNDRCARFIHYQIADLVRTVIAHNAIPSYTYFGGYKEGSELKPHTDRAACEFTLSLNLQQHPHDKPWMLSASKAPLFEKDPNWRGRNPEKAASFQDSVHADLYSGDGFLFMGRHLVHWREGKLPQGHWTNQVFLHFVQEDFTGELA